ncbi:MAG: YraN family protein [Planctomycetota bacterium]
MNEASNRAHELGRLGEQAAGEELTRRGFRILGRNVRLRSAEVDLIARDAAGLVFVEVKSRSTARYGEPYEAVDQAKRDRLIRAALEYIDANALGDPDFRIGVASVLFDPSGRLQKVEWIDEA